MKIQDLPENAGDKLSLEKYVSPEQVMTSVGFVSVDSLEYRAFLPQRIIDRLNRAEGHEINAIRRREDQKQGDERDDLELLDIAMVVTAQQRVDASVVRLKIGAEPISILRRVSYAGSW